MFKSEKNLTLAEAQELALQAIQYRQRRLTHHKPGEKWYGYLFISPLVVGYLVFLLGPIITAFASSFTNWSLYNPQPSWIGFDNYIKLLTQDPLFWQSLANTLYFSLGVVPLNIFLALGLALLLNRKLPGIGIFRTFIFTPVLTSIVVWAIVWQYIFATDSGLINQILRFFGVEGPAWLYNEQLVMPVIIIVSVLKSVGITMIIFLAALQDIPQLYYEAARIDGASRWKETIHITLPLLTPAIFLSIVLTIIGSFKAFAQIYIITDGGPGTSTHVLLFYIYKQAFQFFEYGYGSALAFILFLLILGLTIAQWNLRKRWVQYE